MAADVCFFLVFDAGTLSNMLSGGDKRDDPLRTVDRDPCVHRLNPQLVSRSGRSNQRDSGGNF